MTETDWLTCRDVDQLVAAVVIKARRPTAIRLRAGRASRKIRLFCCACCRRIDRLIDHPADQAALALAEEFAEQPGRYRLDKLPRAIRNVAVECAINGVAILTPHNVRAALFQEAVKRGESPEEAVAREKAVQADLFRDIFGNPFRPVSLEQSGLSENLGTVRKFARTIYEERAFDRLPVLADAFEDAGCADADILNHCRAGGEHVRGCWVVDLILGKK